MTDEETIQRPKGRRNNSIDLGPTGSGESAPKEKRSISLGRKDGSDETRKEPRQKPSFSFSRKGQKEPSDADDVFVQPSRTEPVSTEPVDQKPAEERRTFSASIDLGQTQGQRKTMDMGQQDRGMGTAANGTTGSIDLGPTGSPGTADTDGPETKTQSKKRSALGSVMPFGKKEEEDRKGTWGNTGYTASNEQAHRDVIYHIPSFIKQTIIVFMVQMRLFSKMKWTYFMLFVALLIPIVFFAARDLLSMMMSGYGFMTEYSNSFIAGMLAFLPLLLGLFTSVLCGTQLPNEFKERTAYMNISLPMSRISFYIGKYLAGFVLSLAVFMFAYGMAIATSMSEYDTIFADLLSSSLVLTIVATFAYSATAFCIGSFMRRGSSLIPFLFMTVVLPMVCTLLFAFYMDSGPDLSYLFYLPCFLGEAALGILGAPMSGSAGMIIMPYIDLTNIGTNIAIGIVWGVAFLLLGMYRTTRREM